MAIQDLVIARIGPIISEGLATDKINNCIDNIISMMPGYFEIYDTGLFVEGILYRQPKYRVDYMEIILKTTIQSEERPWQTDCIVTLPDQHPSWADSEIMISQCFLNEALFAIQGQGMLSFEYEGDGFDTTKLVTILGPGILKHFRSGMPCKANIYTTGQGPQVELNID